MSVDRDLNFRVFLFFHIRRVDNEFRDSTVFSIKVLEEFISLPQGTLTHLIKARRLLSESNLFKTEAVLKKYFGFNPRRKLTTEELELREEYEIFN